MTAKKAGKGERAARAPGTPRKRRRRSGAKHPSVNNELFSLLSEELLTSLPEPLMMYDRDLNVIYANALAVDSVGFDPTGLPRAQMLSKLEPHVLIDTSVAEPGVNDPIATDVLGGKALRNVYHRFRNANGETRITLASVTPVRHRGTVIGVIVIWHDVTEQVRREEIILTARDTLETELQERTYDLAESRKKLARSKRLSDLGALAASVAHELRNPLGVIRTAVYNLRRKNADPALERHITNIDKKIDESAMIINNLLNYSKIQVPRLQRVRLADILTECIGSVKKRFRKKDVSLSRRLGKLRGLSLMADPDQMREVFTNILNNAVQAVDEGGSIRVTAEVENGEAAVVEIVDSGRGIAESDIEKVFDPFFTRKAKGTGLGLAICRELTELHNGSISIRSEEGRGTTVSVKLPLERKKT